MLINLTVHKLWPHLKPQDVYFVWFVFQEKFLRCDDQWKKIDREMIVVIELKMCAKRGVDFRDPERTQSIIFLVNQTTWWGPGLFVKHALNIFQGNRCKVMTFIAGVVVWSRAVKGSCTYGLCMAVIFIKAVVLWLVPVHCAWFWADGIVKGS